MISHRDGDIEFLVHIVSTICFLFLEYVNERERCHYGKKGKDGKY